MAKRYVNRMVDDLDRTAGSDVDTVWFGLDGVSYEIDLSAANAERLRGLLAPFVAAGHEKRGPRQWAVVREWARSHGFTPCERGTLPVAIVEAFDNARAGNPWLTSGW